jgi:hypothetical protein
MIEIMDPGRYWTGLCEAASRYAGPGTGTAPTSYNAAPPPRPSPSTAPRFVGSSRRALVDVVLIAASLNSGLSPFLDFYIHSLTCQIYFRPLAFDHYLFPLTPIISRSPLNV